MNKFTTIKASLFNNKEQDNLPDWMKDLEMGKIQKKTLDIDFDKKAAWNNELVTRDERDYSSKQVVAKLNDNEILLSKIELSKFLNNRYYDVVAANKSNNKVFLKTAISNVPGEFNFIYNISDNKISANNIFKYNDSEYPFSRAGLDECVCDIKNKKVTASTKVNNNDKASIISREEIFRRYNGHIRIATDKINELLKEGSIVGVASDSYGTFYDIDYLFPQEEVDMKIDKAPEFEFVDNIEKIATTQKKSSYQLAMEASKQFENAFDDFKYINYNRSGNKLKITAKVLDNNKTSVKDFYFNINNEQIQKIDFKKNTITSSLNLKQKRLNNKNVISKKYINNLLKENGFFDYDVDNDFKKLASMELIIPINEDQYTSELSLNDILDNMDIANQDLEKYYNLINKINEYKFEREDVVDTGIREDIQFSLEYRLSTLYNYLSQKFVNFNISNFTQIDNDNYEADIVFRKNGLKNRLHIYVNFDKMKIKSINSLINNKKYVLKDTLSFFIRNSSLKEYLQNNEENIFTDKIVITLNQIFNKLSNFVDESVINEIISDWIENNYLINIGGDNYVSEYTFEELLNLSNFSILSDEDKENLLSLKMYFGEGLDVERADIKDTGIREDIQFSLENRLCTLYNYLSQKFVKFSISNFNKIDENNYEANIIFIRDGIKNKLHINICFDSDKIISIDAIIKNKKITLNDAIQLFRRSSSLKEYLQTNNGNIYTDKIVITLNQIFNKLKDFASAECINIMFNDWIENNYIVNIGGDYYVSEYTFEELLNLSNLSILSDEDKENLLSLKMYFGEGLDVERTDIKDTGIRENKELFNDEQLLFNVKKYLSQHFKNFEIKELYLNNGSIACSIDLFDDNTGLTLRIPLDFKYNNNNVNDCKCNINGKLIDIKNVKKAFVINASLNKYLVNNKGGKIKSSIIVTKQSLKNKFNKIAKLSDKSLEDTINLLVKNNKMKKIAIDTYASDYTLEELINLSNLKPLSDKEFLARIKKAQTNNLRRLSKNYLNNNDTRDLIDNWTDEEILLKIKDILNNTFKSYQVLDFEFNDNRYIVSVNATDNDGINKIILCYINVDKNHPGNIVDFKNMDNNSEEISQFLINNKANIYNNKGIITKNQIKNQLFNLIDISNLDNIMFDLVNNDLVIPIENDKYIMNNTMSEIVGYLSKNNRTCLVEGKNNVNKANRQEDKIDINVKQQIENDTRKVENKIKLNKIGINIKNNIYKKANLMYNEKKITLNKFNEINQELNKCKTEMELNNINSKLDRYMQ